MYWPTVADHDPCINDVFCALGTSLLPDSCRSESRPLPRPRRPGAASKLARQWPRVTPSPAVPAAGSLRSRLPSPAHLPRLYRSLNGPLGRPNSRHDVPQYFGILNAPISALMSRVSIDTRSISSVNSGRRTMMALGVYGVLSQEESVRNYLTTTLRRFLFIFCSCLYSNYRRRRHLKLFQPCPTTGVHL